MELEEKTTLGRNVANLEKYISKKVNIIIYKEKENYFTLKRVNIIAVDDRGIIAIDDKAYEELEKEQALVNNNPAYRAMKETIPFIGLNTAIVSVELQDSHELIYENTHLPHHNKLFRAIMEPSWHGLNTPLDVAKAIYDQFGEDDALEYLEEQRIDRQIGVYKTGCKLPSDSRTLSQGKVKRRLKKHIGQGLIINTYHESTMCAEQKTRTLGKVTNKGIKVSGKNEQFIDNGLAILSLASVDGKPLFVNMGLINSIANKNWPALDSISDIDARNVELFGQKYVYSMIEREFKVMFDELQTYISSNKKTRQKVNIR